MYTGTKYEYLWTDENKTQTSLKVSTKKNIEHLII